MFMVVMVRKYRFLQAKKKIEITRKKMRLNAQTLVKDQMRYEYNAKHTTQ